MATALQVEFLLAGLVDTSGNPLQDGTVEFFETDGVTPKTIFEDADKITVSANPVTLDIRGTAIVFADGLYSLEIKDPSGSILDTPQDVTYLIGGAISTALGIDASQFGSGDDSDAIAQAIASALGADATVFLIPQQWDIDANITIPSNINILFLWGAFFQIFSGINAGFNGHIDGQGFNIFRGPGTVTIDNTVNNVIPSIWLQTAVAGNLDIHNILTSIDEIQVNVLGGISSADIMIDSDIASTGSEVVFSDNVKVDVANGTFTMDGRSGSLDKTGVINIIGAEEDLGDAYARLNFTNFDISGSSTELVMAQINAVNDGADKGALTIFTRNGGLTEGLRIDNTGNVGIGTTSPDFSLDVSGDIRIESANSLLFGGTGSGDADIGLTRSAANTLQINGDFDLDGNDILNAGTLNAVTFTATTLNATTINVSGQITNGGDVDVKGWLFNTLTFKFPASGQLQIGTTPTTDGWTWDFGDLKAFDTSVETMVLNRTAGRITATESDITRDTVKIISTANAGTAINAAISTLGSAGGIVYLPAGTYSLDATVIINVDNITLLGDGKDQTIIDCDAALTRMIDQQSADNDLIVKGLSLNGAGSSTAQFCIDATATNSGLTIDDCKLLGASTSLVSMANSDDVLVKNTLFTIPANSKGINIDGDNSRIENSTFTGAVATSIGVDLESGTRTFINACTFINLDKGVCFSNTTTDYSLINNNLFDNCNTGIESTVFIEQIYIRDNFIQNGNTHGINIDRSETVFIESNTIENQSGTTGILVGRPITCQIVGNSIKGSTITKMIDVPTGSETTTNVPFVIANNLLEGNTSAKGIDCLVSAHSTANRQSAHIISNIILNCDGMEDVIRCGNDFAIITNNSIVNIDSVASSELKGIQAVGDNVVITNNVVKDLVLTTSTGFSAFGIELSGDEGIISNNIINYGTSSDLVLLGINVSGASDRSNYQGNVLSVTNAGSGSGDAFSITGGTDGVALGNTFAGSDGLGTLSITGGIVVNNDG